MKGDAKVIDYLNKGLRSELTAINQYWLHYRLLDNWGYKDLAKKWRKESIEEMEHADKFVDRIIFLDGFPNMQVLDPLHIGQNVKEILDCDLQAEIDARALYQEAATHCAFGEGLRLARPVRGTDDGRGAPHRLPRDRSSISSSSSACSSTRSTTSASWTRRSRFVRRKPRTPSPSPGGGGSTRAKRAAGWGDDPAARNGFAKLTPPRLGSLRSPRRPSPSRGG